MSGPWICDKHGTEYTVPPGCSDCANNLALLGSIVDAELEAMNARKAPAGEEVSADNYARTGEESEWPTVVIEIPGAIATPAQTTTSGQPLPPSKGGG